MVLALLAAEPTKGTYLVPGTWYQVVLEPAVVYCTWNQWYLVLPSVVPGTTTY